MSPPITENDWTLLNGFADGELSAAEMKDVALRIEREPAHAAELEKIKAVKSALAMERPQAPDQATPVASPHRWRRATRLMIAASVGFGVILGAGGFALWSQTNKASGPSGIHAAFSETTYALEEARLVTLSAGARFADFAVLDLSATNLTLVDFVEYAESARVAFHYRGQRGCRVTLVIDPIASTAPPPRRDALLVHDWRTPQRRYVLLADGMDKNRFRAIGAFAEAMTRSLNTRDSLRTALVERTEAAPPCV